MQATAKAPSNIAFIKYWGKRDEALRIPMNSSISMNLSNAFTMTSVDFQKGLKKDRVVINKQKAEDKDSQRIVDHLDRIRRLAKLKLYAEVITSNNFPQGSGIASSASGFAALSLAATKAAGLKLPQKQLSILARLGSGSACRSIPDGFVEWGAGNSNNTSFAHSLFPADHWDIYDLVAILSSSEKKIGSTKGQAIVSTSPFFKTRLLGMNKKIRELKIALKKRDFTAFGELVEAEALNMHAVMLTSRPALFYWSPQTLELMQAIIGWRAKGLEAYFTIDAGPNVHILCEAKNATKIKNKLTGIKSVKKIITNKPAPGARILS